MRTLTLGILYVVDPLKLNKIGVLRVLNNINIPVLTNDITKIVSTQLSLGDEFDVDDIFVIGYFFILLVVWLETEGSGALHGKHDVIIKLTRTINT